MKISELEKTALPQAIARPKTKNHRFISKTSAMTRDSAKPSSSRRSGRKERMALRAAKPEVHPCPPGQPGGVYRPLSEADLTAIFETALRLLETLGMGEVPDNLAATLLACGAERNDRDRFLLPRSLVLEAIETNAEGLPAARPGSGAQHHGGRGRRALRDRRRCGSDAGSGQRSVSTFYPARPARFHEAAGYARKRQLVHPLLCRDRRARQLRSRREHGLRAAAEHDQARGDVLHTGRTRRPDRRDAGYRSRRAGAVCSAPRSSRPTSAR